MRERNTDVGALAAAAVAATLSMMLASGPYTALSGIISVSLLGVLAGYVFGWPRSKLQRGAVALVAALTALPLFGLGAQLLHLPYDGFAATLTWGVLSIISFMLDAGLARNVAEAPAPERKLEGADVKLPSPGPATMDEEAIYRRVKPLAHPVRTVLQMVIGVVILGALALKIGYGFLPCPLNGWQEYVCEKPVLELVAYALSYSAGIELAYMLFTPGPDEAVQPVTLGIAAAVLIIVSKPSSNLAELLIVPLLCASIGLLFLVERVFIKH